MLRSYFVYVYNQLKHKARIWSKLSPKFFRPKARTQKARPDLLHSTRMLAITRGVFWGGAIGPWPPFWVATIAKLHRKVSKIEAWPPLCKLGIRLWARNHLILGEKWNEIWVKTFFFCSSPDFGRKMGRNLSKTISNSGLCSSQIFWTFCPPLFKILRTLLAMT